MQEDLPNHDGPVDTEEEQGKCSVEQIAPDHDAPIITEGPEPLPLTSKPLDYLEQLSENRVPTLISSIAKDKNSKVPTSRSGILEEYILHAEKYIIARPAKRYCDDRPFTRVFNRGPRSEPIMLRKDRMNRIIIFAGCFNPPHRGHRELLCHTYFNADSKAIAAMIVPLGNVCSGKAFVGSGDTAFQLTREQSTQLWQDEFLGRWSWIYPGFREQIRAFKVRLRNIAAYDGYDIEFLALGGCDHVTVDEGSYINGWGDGNAITSDITRPASFLAGPYSQPFQIKDFGKWRKILPGLGISTQSQAHCWLRHKSCWPCRKFKRLYPEYAHLDRLDDLDIFGGDAKHILRRCHDNGGIFWICRYEETRKFLMFMPSGREYPEDERRMAVSSTNVRRIFAMYAKDEFYDRVKDIVISPGVLMTILGLDKNWLPFKDWKPISRPDTVKDDLIMVKKARLNEKRRNSF